MDLIQKMTALEQALAEEAVGPEVVHAALVAVQNDLREQARLLPSPGAMEADLGQLSVIAAAILRLPTGS